MSREKRCDNCGEPLGYDDIYGEPDHCGTRECASEVSAMIHAERERRMSDAMDDGYGRY